MKKITNIANTLLAVVMVFSMLVTIGCTRVDSDYVKNSGAKDENSSGGTIITPKPQVEAQCFICDGSGKKDCGSCDGGYYTEHESGQYLGYGHVSRDVKVKCKVCRGTGSVKCYH